MSELIHNYELYLYHSAELGAILLEFFGVFVLFFSSIKCFIQWIRRNSLLRLNLAKGIALSLEFKMGSEVFRTVVVRSWSELATLGAVIFLRGLLTFLIFWEIKHEEKQLPTKK